MGFGPLGTSWAWAPNSLRAEEVCDFGAFFGCKFAVDGSTVRGADEESMRSLLEEIDGEAMAEGFECFNGLTRRRKTKKTTRKRRKG